jgi:2-haloacid dehalogenase
MMNHSLDETDTPDQRWSVEDVKAVMGGFAELQCHPDVVDGVRALSELSLRFVTLSNGAASVAQRLLGDAGIADRFDRMLSVQQAQAWKA